VRKIVVRPDSISHPQRRIMESTRFI